MCDTQNYEYLNHEGCVSVCVCVWQLLGVCHMPHASLGCMALENATCCHAFIAQLFWQVPQLPYLSYFSDPPSFRAASTGFYTRD